MKKILLTLVLMVGIVLGLFAQNLTYQAVIRDNNQQLVTNTAMKATVTITFATGTPTTYVETVNATTNLHGLLTFEFGDGTLIGRDFEGATITTTVKSADESTVYVDNLMRPVSAVPYALSVNGQSIQNYLTEHNYVDKAELDSRHYLTSDSTVITTMQGSLLQLSNKLDVQIAKLDSIAHIVDSLSKLPHGGDTPTVFTCGTSKVKDVDLNEYNTVKIGNQCWMKENLRTKTHTYGNVWTNPDVDSTIYGRYYDWAAVMQDESDDTVRGICPEGWHVPSDAEWTQLTTYVRSQTEYVCEGCSRTDDELNTYCIAKALSQPTGWSSNTGTGCNAGNTGDKANSTGFSAVPAGHFFFVVPFREFGSHARFWSATQDGDNAWHRDLKSDDSVVIRSSTNKGIGFSVRCLKD